MSGNPREPPRDGETGADSREDPLLRVEGLRTQFRTDAGTVRAVDGVSFDVRRGETVCLVGESGSGKSVIAESITRIFDAGGRIVGGRIVFDGTDLASLSARDLREVRGARIGHVFQEPGGALNPVYTVGAQIAEAVRLHRDVGRRRARDRAVELLGRVGIPDPAARARDYPHEFSGGMKQRAGIAMALACRPDLLIADEPTTGLDVTTQAAILDLLGDLQAEFGMAVLLVTHDLGVVAEVADRVVVTYAGKVMERGDVFDLFESPAHPYTRALLSCLGAEGDGIPGTLPNPTDPPSGCRFHPRCPHAVPACRRGGQPPTVRVGDGAGHDVSCVHYRPGDDPADALGDGRDRSDGEADRDRERDRGRAGGGDGDRRERSRELTGGEGT